MTTFRSRSLDYLPNRTLLPSLSAFLDNSFLIGLVVLTVFHFWIASWLPPAEDELYYWAWSQSLQGSYYDHPPMVAWLIALSTAIFGDTVFGIRFFACVASTTILASLSLLMPRRNLLALLMLSPLFFLGSVLMTPDVPLLFFWTMYLLWFTHIAPRLARWSDDPVTRVYGRDPVGWGRWIVGGVLLGLGGLSKYTMIVAVPCALLALWTRASARGWWKGFLVHGLIAAVIASPVLVFNFRHEFVPLAFQWNHAMAAKFFSLSHLFSFVGSQVILVGALPFLMLPFILASAGYFFAQPRLQVCFFFFAFPLFFFLYKAMRTPLEANWALVAYVSFWPLAETLFHRNSFKNAGRALVGISFAIPLTLTVAILLHLRSPLGVVQPERDRYGRMKATFELSEQMANDAKSFAKPGEILFLPSYQWTSYFRFRKVNAAQAPNLGRASEFTLNPIELCAQRSALFLEIGATVALPSCVTGRQVLKSYPLIVQGQPVTNLNLIRVSAGGR